MPFRLPPSDLYEQIAQSHPSLLAGRVICGKCGQTRQVEAAACLRHGWPKCPCGGGTMGLASTTKEKGK
ncbi:MAG: hypothetical protein HXY30_09180 [Pseudorhodoplanes sp.]|nr:hypothetical protein [Pseudorhodoplanes sp.]